MLFKISGYMFYNSVFISPRANHTVLEEITEERKAGRGQGRQNRPPPPSSRSGSATGISIV